MRVCPLIVVLIIGITNRGTAQNFSAQPVRGLPSDEVYDLLADSKGFLWAAHALGLSRYDGLSFKTFTNPLATGLGVTDLVEDKQGRIWCHNFNGQVFYIEDEEMHLLTAYKYKEEFYYPRLTVLGDELLITTRKGFFVCNTANLVCKYLYDSLIKDRSRSIVVVKNKLYEFDAYRIARYESGKGFKDMHFINTTKKLFDLKLQALKLLPLFTDDTIYAHYNQSEFCKFIVAGDSIKLVSVSRINNFINTIISCDNKIWTNTKTFSYSNHGDCIKNFNLSDIVIDHEGNTWYSSLNKGLFVQPKYTYWHSTKILNLKNADFIRSHLKTNRYFIYGTQLGEVICKNNTKQTTIKLPLSAGAVEKLFYFRDDEIFIASSNGIYLYDLEKKILTLLKNYTTVKDILAIKDKLYMGVTTGLEVSDIPNTNDIKYHSSRNIYLNDFNKSILQAKRIKENRCYSLAYSNNTNQIVAAFNDGLFKLNHSHFEAINYNNETIPASSLLACGNKIWITTFSNGLFVLENNVLRKISVSEGLLSNTVLELKQFENKIFIIEPKHIQLLDIKTEKIIATVALPSEEPIVVYDLWQEDSLIYLSTNKSIFTIQRATIDIGIIPTNHLLSITHDSITIPIAQTSLSLPHDQNNLQFKIISPSFIYPSLTYFKYRIIGSNGASTWQQTTTNESNISYAALKPDKYRFEAYAVNFQNSKAKPIIYQFEIRKPWWQQLWFIIIIAIVTLVIIYVFVRIRIQAIRKKNEQVVDRLNLVGELRKSQLSTIVAQMNPHFIFNTLNTIQGLIYKNEKDRAGDYIGKFSELVRNILDNSNTENIPLGEEIEQLETYIELEKVRFEDELCIDLHVDDSLDRDNTMVPPILIQPYIENAIVHGLFHKSGNKQLDIQFKKADVEDYLEVIIDDNGIGRTKSQEINKDRKKHISFAISAIEKRIELINQTLTKKIIISINDKIDEVNNAEGTTIKLLIPINLD